MNGIVFIIYEMVSKLGGGGGETRLTRSAVKYWKPGK
jgi:hypothetical protein